MDNLLKQMGTRIYERRRQKRLTQEELAEIAGVTPQTISTAELGKKALRPENLLKICNALEISVDYLLQGQITDVDSAILSHKVAQLTSQQYRYLEDIIGSYISALNSKE